VEDPARIEVLRIERRWTLDKVAEHAARPAPSPAGGAIAVIPIYGLVTQRNAWLGTSTDRLSAQVLAAVADKGVQAIVLDVDSPGGEVYGVPEAAAVIREARAEKPVVAVANAMAASAAYWLGSQASELLVTPSGEAGSIGVYTMHIDVSKALETAGLKVRLVSAGRYKVEGNPFEPLSDEAAAAIQADVDRYYEMFVRDVAKGRRVSVDAVRGDFGQGRLVGAKAAVTERMADGVGTLADGILRAGALAAERRGGTAAAAEAAAIRYRRERGA
jgi:signal peptide peptidase SppA